MPPETATADPEVSPSPAPGAAPPPPDPAASAPTAPPPGDWRATLPPELQSSKSLERYKDVGALARSYVDLERRMGNTLSLPGPEATEQELAAFHEQLGVPKSQADYEFPNPESLDPRMVEQFRGVFHKLGITKEAGAELVSAYLQAETEQRDRMQQEWVEQIKALKAEWGEPLYNRRATAAIRAIEQFAPEAGLDINDVKNWLDETRLGDHPILVRLLGAIGDRMLEDRIIDGAMVGPPDDARRRIAEIQADTSNPVWHRDHPLHKSAQEEWLNLHKLAYGTGEARG